MDITDAKFDEKSHLSEVMWAETLGNTLEYQKLEKLQRDTMTDIEGRLRSLELSPLDRDRQAFLLAGFKMCMSALKKHYDTHLKLHNEESKKEESHAPEKKPVL